MSTLHPHLSTVDVDDYVEILDSSEDSPIIDEAEDGGLIVTLGSNEEMRDEGEREFYSNLAETLPEGVLSRMASDLIRKVEEDKEARKKRDEQYEEALKRTGMGKDAPGGAEFPGASRVVHPMLTKAAIDYQSRVIKELFPANGPCKEMIMGAPDKDKAARAKRVCSHMNWQFREQIKEARTILEVTLSQVPLGGAQYIRLTQDHLLRRPRMDFVSIDHIYLPYSAADFYSAKRRTYAETISEFELRQRISSGMYRKIAIGSSATQPEETKSAKAAMKIEGLEEPGLNLDGNREVYEVMTFVEVTEEMELDKEEPEKFYPYLITIDSTTSKVLSWYRNWEENDEALEPIEHIIEFPFLPWRGAYPVGLPHIIGGLSAAATGALRALLDSAHANNAFSGFVLKGAGVSGQTRTPAIGEMLEIDAGLEVDDIRKKVMPGSFNQPSGVLFQLLGFCAEAGEGVVRTSLDNTQTGEGQQNVPVGTQLSRVEQGLMTFGAVFGRAHAAFNRLINALYRLNRLYLPDELVIDDEEKELLVKREDYVGSCTVKPSSDPTIYSEQQNLTRIAAVQQRAAMLPQLYNARKVEERFLQSIKIPDWEELLSDVKDPGELNAVNENLALMEGKEVRIFAEQNHLAHIQVHLQFIQSPLLGLNPLLAPAFLPPALKHLSAHVVYYYAQHTLDTVRFAAQQEPSELAADDDHLKFQYDELLAAASAHSIAALNQGLAPVAQAVMQVMQQMQQLIPPPPMDPAMAAVKAAEAETQRKAAVDQHEAQMDQGRQASEIGAKQHSQAMAAAALQVKREDALLAAQTKIATTKLDNDTALRIALAKMSSGSTDHFSTGSSLLGG